MRRLTVIALSALLAPTGFCQTVTQGDVQGGVGGGQSPYLSFCQKRFYDEDNGLIRCNWAVDFNFACFVSYPSNKVIQAGSKLSEPEVVGECNNGEPVIKLLHY